MGAKSMSPKPGPLRFGSFAWKYSNFPALSRMICGIGVPSELIAFTSRMMLIALLANCAAKRRPSAAVFTKFVSFGASGSKHSTTPRSSARFTAARKTSVAHAHACS